ncbi:hypothetical protein QQF64_035050 [Cirrhinus molitorella]|uniref:Uncharacterized protein n=1 Tax=Cirrhinus molitorella TaxID=172907 RepID=A0ABR3NF99_9TELE
MWILSCHSHTYKHAEWLVSSCVWSFKLQEPIIVVLVYMVARNTPKMIHPSINTEEDVSSSPPFFSPPFRWSALFSEAVIDASDLVTRSAFD